MTTKPSKRVAKQLEEISTEEFNAMAAKLEKDIKLEKEIVSDEGKTLRERLERVKHLLPRMISPKDAHLVQIDEMVLNRCRGDVLSVSVNNETESIILSEKLSGETVSQSIDYDSAMIKYDLKTCVVALFDSMVKASKVITKDHARRRARIRDVEKIMPIN